MSYYPLAALLVIFLLLLFLLRSLRWKQRSFSIPAGQEIYEDLQGKGHILRSRELGISGKPDMVVRKGRSIIPYEYKSTDSERPRDGHLFQMFAYFAILEENYPGYAVPYGVLKYRNTAFKVHNTAENRHMLIGVIREMRSVTSEPLRNHSNSGKCFRCAFKDICRQSLIKPKQ